MKRILERRRERLGVQRLRPWDLTVDPQGRQATAVRGAGPGGHKRDVSFPGTGTRVCLSEEEG